MLSNLHEVRGKVLESTRALVMDVNKKCMTPLFVSLAKCDDMQEVYKALESYVKNLSFSFLGTCIIALRQHEMARHVSLHDLSKFVLSRPNGVDGPQAEDRHHS